MCAINSANIIIKIFQRWLGPLYPSIFFKTSSLQRFTSPERGRTNQNQRIRFSHGNNLVGMRMKHILNDREIDLKSKDSPKRN